MDDGKTKLLWFLICVCSQTARAQFHVTFVLPENKPEGQYVGNVAMESKVIEHVSESDRDTLRFSFLPVTQYTSYFTLDDVTGDLNTSSNILDREKICEFLIKCAIDFEIVALTNTDTYMIAVKVHILDENDNVPTFPVSSLILNISEAETIGTTFRIKGAFDADMWRNHSIQGHSIVQSEELFELIEPKSLNGSYELNLKLNQSLDRETTRKHFVTIIARDGGQPVLYGTLNITVNVLDDNDNAPVFNSAKYDVNINETIELNTVFLTLSASDKDTGRNAELSYRISDRQSNVEAIKDTFKVNEVTGDISLARKLVYEPTELYEFIVEAVDHGDSPQSSQALVSVTVNDVENNPPKISVNLLSPWTDGFVELKESTPDGFFVARLNVNDNDIRENGKFQCKVQNEFFRLEKFPGTGYSRKIVTNGTLDREMIDTHNVTIICEDFGTPKLTSGESFLVLISDINDNTPKFAKEVFTANLPENAKIGEIVATLTATDDDINENGEIEYRLALENDKRFMIEKNNGKIYSNSSFDRETDSLIVVRVFAIDNGETRNTATATVSVTITDENDIAPTIIPVRPEFWVMENMEANVLVGVINGIDKDLGRNGLYKFSLAPISKVFPFTIDASGEIKTTERLDREQQSRYDIPVTVTDFGIPALSNTQYITIYVGDENDNKPKVTFPNDLNDTVKFMYPVKGYNVVTTVAAYDIDAGENSSLTFSIIEGNELDIFEIDSLLGEISAKSYIDIQKDITVNLLIKVQDKGLVSQATEVNLIVDLVYANATDVSRTGDETGSRNVIIVIVVVITTVAIAIAIIVIILFLRSMDPRKRHSRGDNDSGISSRSDSQSLPPDVDGADDIKSKKRKEVSFSLEFSLDGLDGGRNNESTTDDVYKEIKYPNSTSSPQTSTYSQTQAPKFAVQKQEKIDSHMKALKLQQYLWEAKSRDWEHPDLQQLPLDSESETSRETVTCDSGRGGSVDDVSTTSPSAEEKKRFSFTSTGKDNPKRVSFLPQQLNHQYAPQFPHPLKESTPVQQEPYTYGPPAYMSLRLDSLPSKTRHSTTVVHKPTTQQTRFNPTFSLNSADPWRAFSHRNDLDPLRMRHDSFNSVRSNEDDGGSTTTSGSYTLDPEEIDTDMVNNYGHLVV